MSDGLKPLGDGLGSLFRKLEQRTQDRVELAVLVRAAMVGPEKDHVLSVSYRDETLIVLADSAAWCPQIRYAQRAILEKMRNAGETRFTKLRVRVGRPESPRG
jgi:hypothetical protein